MPTIENNYEVAQVVQELDDVKSFRFSFGKAGFDFLPGQFVVVEHPLESGLKSAVTISSSPTQKDSFSITLKKDGNFGAKFHDGVQVGMSVRIRPPAGLCKLDDGSDQPIVFCGKDHAVTAARSMVRYLRETGSSRRFILFHEISSPDQMLFVREFASEKRAGFRWVPLAVGFTPPAQMKALESDLSIEVLRSVLSEPQEAVYYVTGKGAEVLRVTEVLKGLNLPKDQLFTERWN